MKSSFANFPSAFDLRKRLYHPVCLAWLHSYTKVIHGWYITWLQNRSSCYTERDIQVPQVITTEEGAWLYLGNVLASTRRRQYQDKTHSFPPYPNDKHLRMLVGLSSLLLLSLFRLGLPIMDTDLPGDGRRYIWSTLWYNVYRTLNMNFWKYVLFKLSLW